ncbi:MAG: PAS domain S-box protein [Flavobacteriia bacterium]|nr:PAS domain S-box protein [Flavobacteriia bacterium]
MNPITSLPILIVDDLLVNLISLSKNLQAKGFETENCLSANEAIKKLKEKDYGLLLLDVQMPEMDGFELATFLKNDEKTKNIPIIFITALYPDKEMIMKGLDIGACDFLNKPFDIDILVLKIKNLLYLSCIENELQVTKNELLKKNILLEKKAKRSNFSFEALFYNTRDLSVIVNKEREILAVNDRFVNFDRIESKTLIGKKIEDLPFTFEITNYPLKINECFTLAFLDIVNKEEHVIVKISNTAEGDIYYEINFIKIQDDTEEDLMIIVLRNITKRIAREKELKDHQSLLEMAEKNASLGSWSIDLPEFKIKWSNEMFRLFEFDKKKNEPSHEEFMNKIDINSRDIIQKNIELIYKENVCPGNIIVQTNIELMKHKYILFNPNCEKNSEGKIIRMYGTCLDITEQILTENKLKETKESLENILKIANSGIVLLSKEKTFLYTNPYMKKMLECEDEEIIGKSYLDFILPSEKQKIEELIQGVEEGNQTELDIERILISKSGKKIITHLKCSYVFDESNKIKYVLGIYTDITEKKTNELELEKQRKLFKRILDHFPLGIYISNKKHELEYVNPIAKKLFGKNNSRFCYEYFHDKKQACEFCKNKQVFNGESVTWHWSTPDNKKHFELVDLPLTNIDGSLSKLEIIIDITEKKVFEQKLIESEERFNKLLQEGSDLIRILDEDGKYKYLSPNHTNVLGYEKDELINKIGFDYVHPEDKQAVYSLFQSLKTKKRTKSVPYRILHKDGTWKWVHSIGTNLKDDPIIKGYIINTSEISDLIEAQEQIKLSEYRFKTMISEGSDMIQVFNEKGTCVYASPNHKTILGYSDREVLKNKLSQMVHPNDYAILSENLETVIRKKIAKTKPFRVRHKNGTYRWLQSVGTNLIHDEIIKGVVVNTTDITDLITYQEQLQMSNKRYETVNSVTKDAIYEWDMIKDIYYWGESFYRVFHFPKSKKVFKVKDWEGFMNPDDVELFYPLWNRIMQNPKENKWQKEYRIKNGLGEFVYVEEIAHIFRDEQGKPIRMIGVLRDINETKELQKLLDTASKLAMVGGCEIDFINENHHWTEITKEIFDVSSDFVPRVEKIFSFFEGEYLETLKKAFNNAKNKGKDFDLELKIITEKNNHKWVRIIGNTEMVKGKCVKILGSFQDITVLKTNEYALTMLHDKLEKYTQRLENSNKELEQFAYVASHDLQEPLRMVTGFLTQLEKKYFDLLDDKAKQYINFAVDGAKRMREMILGLLEYSRLTKRNEDKEPIDINEIVISVLSLNHKLIKEKRAKIIYKKLPIIVSYKTPMMQVFKNLIENALKYSKDEVDCIIEISADETEKEFILSIKDNGIGIDKQYHDKVFLLFQRTYLIGNNKGMGMGLSIVKRSVENMGGNILLFSELGEGSTFQIHLPKA